MLRSVLGAAAALVISISAAPAFAQSSAAAEALARAEALVAQGRAAVQTDLEREVLEADIAFAAEARKIGVAEAFKKWAAPQDALFITQAPKPFSGAEEISQALGRNPGQLVWAPKDAQASGDLGVTMGEAIAVLPGEGGERVARFHYLTVWRKTADGWRYTWDLPIPIREAR